MKFELEPLPYAKDALEPHMSARTVDLHYERHHRGYLEKLRKAIEDKPEAQKSLEEIVRSSQGFVFNQAAQVWNHDFFWKGMKPGGGGEPDGELRRRLESSFGSVGDFKQRFAEVAKGEFGSGYAWLVLEDGALQVRSSHDAENPLSRGGIALLGCDVWEHAYYLDYQNERGRYVEAFLDHLVSWDFVAQNLARAQEE